MYVLTDGKASLNVDKVFCINQPIGRWGIWLMILPKEEDRNNYEDRHNKKFGRSVWFCPFHVFCL